MKSIYWTPMNLTGLEDEVPPVVPDATPTEERPAVTTDLLIEDAKRRSEEEREVLREISRRYSPLGIERPRSRHGQS